MDRDIQDLIKKQIEREYDMFYLTTLHEYYAEKMDELGIADLYEKVRQLKWLPENEMQIVKEAYEVRIALDIDNKNKELNERFDILIAQINNLGLGDDYQLYHYVERKINHLTKEKVKAIEKFHEEQDAKTREWSRKHQYINPNYLK